MNDSIEDDTVDDEIGLNKTVEVEKEELIPKNNRNIALGSADRRNALKRCLGESLGTGGKRRADADRQRKYSGD